MKYIRLNLSRIKVLLNWAPVRTILREIDIRAGLGMDIFLVILPTVLDCV